MTMQTLASSAMTGSYVPFDAAGLSNNIQILKVKSTSNVNATISFDGVNDHDFIAAGSGDVMDVTTNSRNNLGEGCSFAKGQVIYLKAAAGTGNYYLIGYSQST